MVVLTGYFFTELLQIVLSVGVLDMGDQFAATAGNIHAAAQQISGSTHFSWIRVRDGEIAAPGFTGLVSTHHTVKSGGFPCLLWPLLTPARSPCMLPCRALS